MHIRVASIPVMKERVLNSVDGAFLLKGASRVLVKMSKTYVGVVGADSRGVKKAIPQYVHIRQSLLDGGLIALSDPAASQ